MPDLYSTLGVERAASEAEIKSAYRKLAKQLHPDRNKDNPKAAERFKQVSSAYAILEDADKRARYDRGEIDEEGNPKIPAGFGRGAGGGFQGFRAGAGPGGGASAQFEFSGDPSDLFAELFRGGRAGGGAGRGSPFGGGGGSPFSSMFEEEGFRPSSKGQDRRYALSVPFDEAARLEPQRVALAGGKTIEIKLPAGFDTGSQIRLAGQGEPGPAGNGDAIVELTIQPHAIFSREGDDVRLDLPVSLKEAVLGAKVRAPTVDGAVSLTVPAGTTSGRLLRLKGKGFHKKGGGRGDQIVRLMVDLPRDDAELRAFAERWEGDAAHDPRAAMGV